MPLELHPMVESDLPDFVRIQFAAFKGGMASKLTPKPRSPQKEQKMVEKHIKSFKEDPDAHYLKVIDTDLGGKIISCAKWRINLKERTEEEIQVQLPKPGKDEEGNQAAIDFMNYLTESRVEWMGGKPFYFLHILITDPDHHRRGAGGMLVRWGVAQADEAQLPTYLEASDAGRPLYERFGFYQVKETIFDLSKYGGEGTERNTAMLRDPLPK
ncbi:acyl-CoA N-acyltransferase [Zopfia rhizophila CBS 207.26]|uniref:Acyl-CoA N-acyltransferase n=1 Tax=Zopfia rhizophila CBS 207.26 TaxID=1314779 RepID=A0A6A6DTU9_9PEZI|nr:acyl-CoA N-acyltransferase [Zopfia rhizophila CBS 207.26]